MATVGFERRRVESERARRRLVGRDALTSRLRKRVRIIGQGWERSDVDGHIRSGDPRQTVRVRFHDTGDVVVVWADELEVL